jgi:conserved domain protein
MMQIKVFCMVVLCAFLFIACEKDNDDYEPIKPPVEQPEEPVKPEKPDEPEKPEKPTTPPATDDIINVKIGDSNMIVGSNNWNAITYGNGKYVAVGEKGYVTMSTNGVDWSTPKQVGSKVWHAITYANGKFVAVGGGVDIVGKKHLLPILRMV